MLIPNVVIAGQDYTAQVVVPQTLTMQQAVLQAFMSMDVSYSVKEWNVPLWLRLHELWVNKHGYTDL